MKIEFPCSVEFKSALTVYEYNGTYITAAIQVGGKEYKICLPGKSSPFYLGLPYIHPIYIHRGQLIAGSPNSFYSEDGICCRFQLEMSRGRWTGEYILQQITGSGDPNGDTVTKTIYQAARNTPGLDFENFSEYVKTTWGSAYFTVKIYNAVHSRKERINTTMWIHDNISIKDGEVKPVTDAKHERKFWGEVNGFPCFIPVEIIKFT